VSQGETAISESQGGSQIGRSGVPKAGRAAALLENVTESATACLLTMVQGNVLALGVGHWIAASQTGLAAGVVASVALWLSGGRGRFVVASILAVATAAVDYMVHPGGFGPVAFEAVATGLAAGGLSLVVGALRGRFARR
jgi:hypothetical protein